MGSAGVICSSFSVRLFYIYLFYSLSGFGSPLIKKSFKSIKYATRDGIWSWFIRQFPVQLPRRAHSTPTAWGRALLLALTLGVPRADLPRRRSLTPSPGPGLLPLLCAQASAGS